MANIAIAQALWADDINSGTTISVVITVGQGSTLYVVATNDEGGGTPTITVSDGTGYTGIGTVIADPGNQGIQAFYRPNVNANTYTVVASYSPGAPVARGIMVAEIVNATGTPLNVSGPGNFQATPGAGTDTITSGTAQSNTAQPALVVALSILTGAAGLAPLAGTGFTSPTTNPTGWAIAFAGDQARVESKRVTSLAAQQGLFTPIVNSGHCTTMAVFLETGSGGAPPSNSLFFGAGSSG